MVTGWIRMMSMIPEMITISFPVSRLNGMFQKKSLGVPIRRPSECEWKTKWYYTLVYWELRRARSDKERLTPVEPALRTPSIHPGPDPNLSFRTIEHKDICRPDIIRKHRTVRLYLFDLLCFTLPLHVTGDFLVWKWGFMIWSQFDENKYHLGTR